MTEDTAPLRIFRGQTVHQRAVPFLHRFRYNLAMIDIDIDQIAEAGRDQTLFSTEKANLFYFRAHDHARGATTNLRDWAEACFKTAGLDMAGARIRLLTFPRHTFYKFSPISLWVGYAADGQPCGIIYEVNNTFGESHAYVAEIPDADRACHATEKSFHVSPFFDVAGHYQFTLRINATRLSLVVTNIEQGRQTHTATLQGRFVPANSANFMRVALTMPLSTLGVSIAIHWQALKLWLKGAAYHSKPKQRAPRISQATENTQSLARPRETAL